MARGAWGAWQQPGRSVLPGGERPGRPRTSPVPCAHLYEHVACPGFHELKALVRGVERQVSVDQPPRLHPVGAHHQVHPGAALCHQARRQGALSTLFIACTRAHGRDDCIWDFPGPVIPPGDPSSSPLPGPCVRPPAQDTGIGRADKRPGGPCMAPSSVVSSCTVQECELESQIGMLQSYCPASVHRSRRPCTTGQPRRRPEAAITHSPS